MRIPDNHPNSMLEKYLLGTPSVGKSKGTEQGGVNQGASSVEPAQTDSVNISPQAQEIAKLHQMVSSSSDLTADKVSSIQKQLSDGTYSVNPEQIAKKLVKDTILNNIL